MEEKVIKKTEESINKIIDEGLNTNNLETLYKLIDIYKDAKEVESMNYGNYNGYGREQYGDYDEYGARRRDSRGRYMESGYGARGYDMRYRGHEDLDRMSTEYNRYMENRERYGANDDTKRSLKYMLESMEDFARKLRQDAQSQEEVQMIRDTAQRIAQM